MARWAALVRPDVDVITDAVAVEDVPLARLRCDIMASCVDSRAARQVISTCARRLNTVLVDAAVQGEHGLARVAIYGPAPDQPCLECRWSSDDYALLEGATPCNPVKTAESSGHRPATGAPAELGALAAAHQAMAIRGLLRGERTLISNEIFINARQQIMYSGRFAHNPACRFDHKALHLKHAHDLNQESSVADLIEAFAPRALSVEGHAFIFDAACQVCRSFEPVAPHLSRTLRLPPCGKCGAQREASGLTSREKLNLDRIPATLTLADTGVRDGDVLALHHVTRPRTQDNLFIEIGHQHD
ncbi:MAG: hypothetical protein O3A63_22015, partial [Proteobacteria bacterium]|nr:hypothetical protein [Pseudomonadota bacterium]